MYGRLADANLGRKKSVVISCILTSATSFLTSFSSNLYIYAFLRFANGFARSGIGICCLVLSTEVVGRKWRGQIGQYGFVFFTIGFLSLPLIAYLSRTSWRNVYRIISILPLPYSLLILFFVSESPRWLLVRGRGGEALDVLNKFARLNGKQLPPNLRLVNPARVLDPVGAVSRRKSLWSTWWAAKRMVMVMVAGFGVGFVYYGVQLNVENLSLSLYLTAAINALMEIPAVFIGSFLLGFSTRRLLFSGSIGLAGVSCIVCIFFSGGRRRREEKSTGSWLQLSIEAFGFMAAALAFNVLYIYCVELFPTNVRNFAVSMLRQALMLGASITPLLVVVGRLNPARSFLIFGLLSVVSGVLGMCLPETKDAPLYETLEQQEEEEKHGLRPSNDSGLELELGK